MHNCRVVFEPMGVALDVEPGKSILEIASDNSIPIRSDCGGKGLCGKCLVAVNQPDNLSRLSEQEMRFLKQEQVDDGYRLACQAKVNGPVNIAIPSGSIDSGEAGYKTGISGNFTPDPMIERLFLPASGSREAQEDGAMDLVGRVRRRMKKETGKEVEFRQVHSLRSVSSPFVCNHDITVVNHLERGVTAVLKGDRRRSLGVALDIGTTTLAAYLCDLAKGELLASSATANPQRRYGEDVISRISYANEYESGMEMLHKTVTQGINEIIGRCLEKAGAEREDVDEVTVVGNTTMQQAFAGIHLNGLGFAPYFPVARIIEDMTASDLGLGLNPGTNVHFFPMISGFVGGDTMGVIISERPYERDDISLIVDIGTNGEIVLGNRKGLWVTSCATGPALEGAQIECGMRASSGAIHRLGIDPDSLRVSYEVLGEPEGDRPRGLCGSAIIDSVAEMLRNGIMLPSGRLKEGMPGVITDEKGIGRQFILVPAEKSQGGKEISITLTDIRQIQLAKGALATGIKMLMKNANVNHIDRIVLTGAFGARFDWRNAVAIGMLPDAKAFSRVEVVENAAGVGAIKALLNRSHRKIAEGLVPSIRFLELAEERDFPTQFAMAMTFPPEENQA